MPGPTALPFRSRYNVTPCTREEAQFPTPMIATFILPTLNTPVETDWLAKTRCILAVAPPVQKVNGLVQYIDDTCPSTAAIICSTSTILPCPAGHCPSP